MKLINYISLALISGLLLVLINKKQPEISLDEINQRIDKLSKDIQDVSDKQKGLINERKILMRAYRLHQEDINNIERRIASIDSIDITQSDDLDSIRLFFSNYFND